MGRRKTIKNCEAKFHGSRKVLSMINPDVELAYEAEGMVISILNSILCTIIEKAHKLLNCSKNTITSREIQVATQLTMDEDLAKYAIQEGNKAIVRFEANPSGTRDKPITKSERAGLLFSAGHLHRMIKRMQKANRVSEGASVYICAVLEYISAEILEIAANAAMYNSEKYITNRHIQLAIRNDESLDKLIRGNILGGGVVPNIHYKLFSSNKPALGGSITLRGGAGKGLGKGGLKRHRVIMRDNIQGITKAGLQRLCHRAGIKFMSGLIYEELRGTLKVFLEKYLYDIILLIRYYGRKTVFYEDVIHSAIDQAVPFVTTIGYPRYRANCAKNYISEADEVDNESEELLSLQSEDSYEKPKSDHGNERAAPGEVAIKEIQKQQGDSGFLFAMMPFQRLVRELAQYYMVDIRFSADAFYALQAISEDYMLMIAHNANFCAIHANRQTVQPKDLSLVRRLQLGRASKFI